MQVLKRIKKKKKKIWKLFTDYYCRFDLKHVTTKKEYL